MADSPVIRFRLPEPEHELLETLAAPDSAGKAAKRIVLDWLEEHAGVPLKRAREHKLGESSEGRGNQEHLSSVKAAAPPDPDENALKRAVRLKQEWYALEAQNPGLAREYGSFEEYERRHEVVD